MATQAQIAELRTLIAEPTDAEPWTDSYLSGLIDAYEGDLRASAGSVWTAKAASTAHLVNISEGGSSRSMSDVHKNALAMAKAFTGDVDAGGSSVRRPPRTRAIERP